jgi:hypothetical protein
MATYYEFSQKHFEYKLRGLCMENKFGFMVDITEEIQKEEECFEKVYKIATRNRAVDIIVYSSVSINANKVRKVGEDAVRVVLRWKTKDGYFYKRVGKNYRVKTLFDNLKETLKKASDQIFSLNMKEFSKELA